MTAEETTPAQHIDQRIAELEDWRGQILAQARQLIRAAVPEVVEEWKWRGVPTWESAGILTTGETYQDKVKFTFPHGAQLPDPAGLFNASLAGNARRAIDLFAGDLLDEAAFTQLILDAAELNAAKKRKK